MASGLAVWPVLFLALPALGFHSRRDRLLWLGAMFVVLVAYFVHYQWLRRGVWWSGPMYLGGFLLAYLGSPLVLFDAGALAAARWIAVAGLALTATNGVYLWRAGQDADRRRLAAGVALIALALACGVLTAAGRGGSHGMVQALASRYVTHGSLFSAGRRGPVRRGPVGGAGGRPRDAGPPGGRGRQPRRARARRGANRRGFPVRSRRAAAGDRSPGGLRARVPPVARDITCLRGLHPRPWRIAPRIDQLFVHRLAVFADVP